MNAARVREQLVDLCAGHKVFVTLESELTTSGRVDDRLALQVIYKYFLFSIVRTTEKALRQLGLEDARLDGMRQTIDYANKRLLHVTPVTVKTEFGPAWQAAASLVDVFNDHADELGVDKLRVAWEAPRDSEVAQDQ